MSISQDELASLARLPHNRRPSSSAHSEQGILRPRNVHGRKPSSDFGDFASGPSTRPSVKARGDADQLDLLGSFEEVPAPIMTPGPGPSRPSAVSIPRQPSPNVLPTHVTLPPRPSEISPDYVPPRHPRRLSQSYTFPGPSSPPLLSAVGKDIVFHPSSESSFPDDDDPFGIHRPVTSTPMNSRPQVAQSPSQSRLLNTLATTTKLAQKWKSVLDPHAFLPPSHHIDEESERPATAAVDITHSTPFASAEQVAGSYVAPTGAPGFEPHSENDHVRQSDTERDWAGTMLYGRREGTFTVLTSPLADKLRKELPPRQRLSSSWTLLFSLDQHGASLSTLYRLVERHAASHRSAANILVVQDGDGNVFGSFLNEAIIKREGTYYGSGESFLFKVDAGEVRTFRWTGRNQYFALCESGFISFGGGGGAYGLLLDSAFGRNSSATSPAFDNEILCTHAHSRSDRATYFDCVALEVWST